MESISSERSPAQDGSSLTFCFLSFCFPEDSCSSCILRFNPTECKSSPKHHTFFSSVHSHPLLSPHGASYTPKLSVYMPNIFDRKMPTHPAKLAQKLMPWDLPGRVQCLKIFLWMQQSWVQSLVQKVRSHMPWSPLREHPSAARKDLE